VQIQVPRDFRRILAILAVKSGRFLTSPSRLQSDKTVKYKMDMTDCFLIKQLFYRRTDLLHEGTGYKKRKRTRFIKLFI
jgi:hypothetical protein